MLPDISGSEYIKIFTGIISVLNPIGAIPVFVGLTSDRSDRERASIARFTALSVTIILLVAAISGQAILHFFGISIASFRVGGGILILLMAISMLHAKVSHAKHTPDEFREAGDADSIAVVPLAIPLLAGPGAISTVIVYSHQAENLINMSALFAVIIVAGVIVYTALRMAVPLSEKLGTIGINIAVRLLGLLLAAIAVEFMAAGLRVLFPGLM